MKTVVVISFSNLESDPRVNRQIRWLKESYRVVTLGLAAPGVEGVDHLAGEMRSKNKLGKLGTLLKLVTRSYERHYWNRHHIQHALELLAPVQADVIIANDIDSLPLALKAAKGAKVFFDAHEYSPREFEEQWKWRLLYQGFYEYLCRTYLPKADSMVTVCQGIAEAYKSHFNVEPGVITNAPSHAPLEPRPVGSKIRMIHHGAALPNRKIENMVRMMDQLDDRFELDLMLTSPHGPSYLEYLKGMATNPRIRFLDPVPMPRIVETISAYDMGLYLLEPSSFNNAMALPNKLFEFIQARLAIAIGPSPEMARIVREHECGVVAPDFQASSLAASLNALTAADIERFKANTHRIAPLYSAEQNREQFIGGVESLLRS